MASRIGRSQTPRAACWLHPPPLQGGRILVERGLGVQTFASVYTE
jgi:hypothetical protein